MVFPSVPLFLDPPNWNQQQPVLQQHPQQQPGITGAGDVQHQLLQAPQAASSAVGAPPGAAAAIRPTSMAERARLAKIPQPEPALKCPRCDSANTKFCYFNNYSLSQPRHFCKTCRRYWTRGGALRNVPVGGGCRRNKRNKASSSSKSTTTSTTQNNNSDGRHGGATGAGQSSSSTSSTTTSASSSSAVASNIQGLPHLPFMSSLQLRDQYNHSNISLNFNAGIQPPVDRRSVDNYHGVGSCSNIGIDHQQWRSLHQIQQFPNFLGGVLEQAPAPQQQQQQQQQQHPTALFPFDNSQFSGGQVLNANKLQSSSGLISQLASVKMDDHKNLQLPRNYQQFWTRGSGGSNGEPPGSNTSEMGWQAGDLSRFNSTSSTSGNDMMY